MKLNSALVTFSVISDAILLAYAHQALLQDGSNFFALLCFMWVIGYSTFHLPSFPIPRWMKIGLLIIGTLQTTMVTVAWHMRPLHPHLILNLFIFGVLMVALHGYADILKLLRGNQKKNEA